MVAMVRAFRANEKICLIFSELTVDRGHVKVAKSFVTLTIRCYAMLFSWRQIFLMGNHLARIKSFFLQHPDAMRRLLLSLSLTLFTYEHKNNHLCRASFSYPHERATMVQMESSHLFRKICLQYFICLDGCAIEMVYGAAELSLTSTQLRSKFLSASSALIIYRCVCLSLPLNINFCAEWNISTLR